MASRWDARHKHLYVPLVDVESAVVGYKVLSIEKNELVERTVPDTNCSGLIYLKCSAVVESKMTATAKAKDQSSAILVLNVLDMLALSTAKINGEQHS